MSGIITLSILFFVLGIIYIVVKSDINTIQKIVIGGCLIFFTVFELVLLGKIPGFFGDESFAMYDSWALAHYGIDSHLMHNPVYSLSSGGQSVLYGHLAIPFMKAFGMNLAAFRFPMAFLTIFSVIFLIYSLLRIKINSNYVVGITISLTTCEWLLMYGRWALDCSIVVPFFISILGCIFISVSEHKKIYGYISLFLIALLSYCYVGLWIILPFLFACVIYIQLKCKNFNQKDIIVSILVSFILLIPIICYLLVQFCGVKPFKILWFSVGALGATRAGSSMITFKGNIIDNIVNNTFDGLKQLVTGNDLMFHSSIPNYSIIHLLMFVLAVIGLFGRKNNKEDKFSKNLILLSLMLVPILLLVLPNFNHWSIIIVVLSIWSGLGLGKLLNLKKKFIIKAITIGIIFISTGIFTNYYFTDYLNKELTINQFPGYIINFKESRNFISKLNKLNVDNYYGIPFDCDSFMRCLEDPNPNDMDSLQKYHTDLPQQLQSGKSAYIVQTKDVDNYDYLKSLSYIKMNVNGHSYTVFYNK